MKLFSTNQADSETALRVLNGLIVDCAGFVPLGLTRIRELPNSRKCDQPLSSLLVSTVMRLGASRL
jgi:hypothetical protein